jgi:hypothetical protein
VGVAMAEWIHFNKNDEDIIKVQLSDGKTEVIRFDSLSLLPGDSCEYTVKLKRDNFSKYELSLNFVDDDPQKTLKDYVHVKIITGKKVIYDDLLATAFEDGNIVLPVDFTKKQNTELKIVYYLPLEVGNEAKNAEALFKIQLTAHNE